MKTPSPAKTNTLQTLDRGLQVLALIANRAGGWSIAELAAELGVHRAIAYRLVATLEQHGLIARLRDGRIVTGAGVIFSNAIEGENRMLSRNTAFTS